MSLSDDISEIANDLSSNSVLENEGGLSLLDPGHWSTSQADLDALAAKIVGEIEPGGGGQQLGSGMFSLDALASASSPNAWTDLAGNYAQQWRELAAGQSTQQEAQQYARQASGQAETQLQQDSNSVRNTLASWAAPLNPFNWPNYFPSLKVPIYVGLGVVGAWAGLKVVRWVEAK